jgi:hypothetical protein
LYPEYLPAMLKGEKKKQQQHTKFSISAKNGQKRAKSKRVNSVTQSRQRDPGERQKNKSNARLGRGKQDNGDAAATPQLFCAQLRKQRQREERRETNRVTRRRPLPLSEVPPLWTPGPRSAAPGARPVIFFYPRFFPIGRIWSSRSASAFRKDGKFGCFIKNIWSLAALLQWKRLKLFVCLSVHSEIWVSCSFIRRLFKLSVSWVLVTAETCSSVWDNSRLN